MNMKLLRAYTKTQLMALARTPAYWLPVLFFPAMLYGFFGTQAGGDPQFQRIFLGSWSVFAVLGISVFQFGVAMAVVRQSPWEAYSRTLPSGPGVRFAAQIIVAVLFSFAALLLVWGAGVLVGGVVLEAGTYITLAAVLIPGAIPFVLFGIWLAYAANPRAAVPFANLSYLALAYLGGLWVPPQALPGTIEAISRIIPTRHYGELAWAVTLNTPVPWESLLWLTGYAVLFAALAARAYRKDKLERFG